VRRQLARQLRAADLAALPGGARLRQPLLTVWSDSSRADDAYVTWTENQAFCVNRAGDDAAKQRGDHFSVLATAAKTAFLRQWNPIAAQYGLASRDFSRI